MDARGGAYRQRGAISGCMLIHNVSSAPDTDRDRQGDLGAREAPANQQRHASRWSQMAVITSSQIVNAGSAVARPSLATA